MCNYFLASGAEFEVPALAEIRHLPLSLDIIAEECPLWKIICI